MDVSYQIHTQEVIVQCEQILALYSITKISITFSETFILTSKLLDFI